MEPGDCGHEVVEASFVDETALALNASSPKAFGSAIMVLLEVVTETFQKCVLNIHVALSKTETLLQCRRKSVAHCLDAKRTPDGLQIKLPKRCGHPELHVVLKCKHLGSVVHCDDIWLSSV